jgi:hypothetical protein
MSIEVYEDDLLSCLGTVHDSEDLDCQLCADGSGGI